MTALRDRPISKVVEARRRPDAVTLLTVYLILLMAIPSSLVFAPLGAAGGPATLLAVALMVAYLAMRFHPESELDTGRQPLRVAGTLFLCSILVAYVSANRHSMPRIEQNGADRGVISAIGWLAVLLLAADGIDQSDRLRALLNRIVMGACGLAVVGVAQFFTGVNYAKYVTIPGLTFNQTPTDIIIRGGFNRPSATTAQPLEFAAVMVMVFPLAIHQARYASTEIRFRNWLKVGILAIAILMTVSRTAIVGLAVTAIVLLPTWNRIHRRHAYAVLAISGIALFLMAPRLLSTFANLLDQIVVGSSSTDSRTTAIGLSLPYISEHPWLGSGFGTFPPQLFFFTDNQYLSSLITVGGVGLGCLITLFLTAWLVARSLRAHSEWVEISDLAQSLAAVIAVAAVCFATFDVLSFATAAGLTFLFAGCIGAAWRLYGARRMSESMVT